jgi:hypothetical protein
MKTTTVLAVALLGVMLALRATAQEPKFAAKVPESIQTPDIVHTQMLGDLEFFDGTPNRATVKKAYDFLDLTRGSEAVYGFLTQDAEGNYLDGGKTYDVTLPHPIPVNNFWSFMVYSGQHRSMLETDQKLAGLDSNNPSVKPNADGSYTIWFGPKPPQGHEGNWIQTMPGKSYNVLLRLYGPLQPWFDKTWKPGDFELVQ